jgi:hypothetical protein
MPFYFPCTALKSKFLAIPENKKSPAKCRTSFDLISGERGIIL